MLSPWRPRTAWEEESAEDTKWDRQLPLETPQRSANQGAAPAAAATPTDTRRVAATAAGSKDMEDLDSIESRSPVVSDDEEWYKPMNIEVKVRSLNGEIVARMVCRLHDRMYVDPSLGSIHNSAQAYRRKTEDGSYVDGEKVAAVCGPRRWQSLYHLGRDAGGNRKSRASLTIAPTDGSHLHAPPELNLFSA